MTTYAIPESAATFSKNSFKAWIPPADAPMPTMRKSSRRGLFASLSGFRCFDFFINAFIYYQVCQNAAQKKTFTAQERRDLLTIRLKQRTLVSRYSMLPAAERRERTINCRLVKKNGHLRFSQYETGSFREFGRVFQDRAGRCETSRSR